MINTRIEQDLRNLAASNDPEGESFNRIYNYIEYLEDHIDRMEGYGTMEGLVTEDYK